MELLLDYKSWISITNRYGAFACVLAYRHFQNMDQALLCLAEILEALGVSEDCY